METLSHLLLPGHGLGSFCCRQPCSRIDIGNERQFSHLKWHVHGTCAYILIFFALSIHILLLHLRTLLRQIREQILTSASQQHADNLVKKKKIRWANIQTCFELTSKLLVRHLFNKLVSALLCYFLLADVYSNLTCKHVRPLIYRSAATIGILNCRLFWIHFFFRKIFVVWSNPNHAEFYSNSCGLNSKNGAEKGFYLLMLTYSFNDRGLAIGT